MAIGFNSIPMDIRTPGHYNEFDGSRALRGLPAIPHVAIIVAPRLSTGTTADLVPFRINSKSDAELGFGRHSIGSFMGKRFKTNNKYTELWGVGVADSGSGVAATGTLTLVGTTTADGVFYLYVAGIRIPVTIVSGATPTVAAVAIVAALADYEVPVTATNLAGVITFTARNTGTTGNSIDLRCNYIEGEKLPAGMTSATFVAMASGATNGSIANAIAAWGDAQYHTVISAWDDDTSLDLYEAELLDRWGPMEQKEGHLFAASKGSQGTMTTAGNARNSFNSTLMGSGLSPSPTYEWAAAVGAVDAFQSSVDPARPRTTLPLLGILPPAKASILTRPERNTLLTDGVSTFTVDDAGTVMIERLITTYQTTNSVADATYLDIMTVRTLAALRYTQRARLAVRFPRHKLADDGTNFGPGQPIVTPAIIRSELVALFMDWVAAGWVENLEQFKTDLIVQRNTTDVNRVDILSPPDLINAFLVSATSTQFLL